MSANFVRLTGNACPDEQLRWSNVGYGMERTATKTTIKSALLGLSAEGVILAGCIIDDMGTVEGRAVERIPPTST
jgi:hypothetical protein